MGIHNSSILSTERRVVNHNTFKPNMKAFMTACAVLASSANADPQLFSNLVNLGQTVRHPGLIQPYNVVPLNHVSYAHTFNAPLPLGPVMASVPSYNVAALPIHHFIKRDAEPETPYEIKSKVENPADGSEQEVQIKVDASGKGKSFQRVEQKDQPEVMRDNYILEHRRMAQRPLISKMYMAAQRGVDRNHQMGMNQMRLDRNQMGMDRNQMEMYRSQQQRLEDQMRIQQNREAMLVENMGQRNDQLRRQMAAHPRQTANNQQLGMNQMVQLINHNLKNAVESHSETGKSMMTALESHEELGQNLRDAIKLYESTPATLGSRRYSNMRDAMVMNNNQMVGHNMREGQMIHHQNQMIHPQNQMIRPQDQMIHTQQMRI